MVNKLGHIHVTTARGVFCEGGGAMLSKVLQTQVRGNRSIDQIFNSWLIFHRGQISPLCHPMQMNPCHSYTKQAQSNCYNYPIEVKYTLAFINDYFNFILKVVN